VKALGIGCGFVLGFAAGMVIEITLVDYDTISTLLLGAFTGLGYLVGSIADSAKKQAEALATMASAAVLPYALATGVVTLGDLIEVDVPDAPPADMGGES